MLVKTRFGRQIPIECHRIARCGRYQGLVNCPSPGALGCSYGAVGTTFGEGSFIAQIPNNLEDRLATTSLPRAGEETIEAAIAGSGNETVFVTWPCGTGVNGVPDWLAQPRAMRWVGGLFTVGDPPSAAARPFTLTTDFDGLFYLPVVTAEAIPTDRPVIPARSR